MIVRTKLAEVQDQLAAQFENVHLKGQGAASFLYVANDGRAVEISEDYGGFWLEFWERSDDEDAAPTKEMSVESGDQAAREARRWLQS
jgi:hypothetical protein